MQRFPKSNSIVFVLLFCLSSRDGWASIATGLDSITEQSDVIVIAHVDEVILIHGGHVALATVSRSIKGLRKGEKLAFLAERLWTCDTSGAVRGENALLCLARWRGPHEAMETFFQPTAEFEADRQKRLAALPFYEIAESGRGRMSLLKAFGGQDYIERPASTEFPDSVLLLRWTSHERRGIRVSRLADVERAIHNLMKLKSHK